MRIKKNILIAIFVVLASGLGLGVAMTRPLIVIYIPIICLCALAFGLLFEHKRLSRSIDAWFTQHRLTGAIWLLDVIGGLTLIGAITAFVFEPIAWRWLSANKIPTLLSFSFHILLAGLVVVMCVVLYAWQVHVEKNKPNNRRGNKVLSWVIQYLQNETTVGRGKSNEYLIEFLSFEVKVGRLHLWGRKNNKDVFIRPKDFKSKHYFFELYNNRYRICSLVDGSVVWSPTFIEREVKNRWPSEQTTNP